MLERREKILYPKNIINCDMNEVENFMAFEVISQIKLTLRVSSIC